MDIQAIVKTEGSQWVVRLIDQHGLELPAWVYGERFSNYQGDVQGIEARDKARAVAEFINNLPPSVRYELYQSLTR